MKRYVFFCLLILNSVSIFAREIVWHEGSVVLKTKEVLVGEISIEPEYDLILHRVNEKVEVYPAHKIQSVYFYDEAENINRKFISIKTSSIFSHHQLYEIVLRGEVNLYRKQKSRTGNSPSDAEGFNYFLFYHDQLIALQKFRVQVFPYLLESAGSEVSVFIDDHRLNPNSPSDAIRIIQFYNKLEKRDQLLAKH